MVGFVSAKNSVPRTTGEGNRSKTTHEYACLPGTIALSKATILKHTRMCLVLELSFLQHASTLSFDPALSSGDWLSREFARLVVWAQSLDDAFFIHTVHGVCLLYHHPPSALSWGSLLFPWEVACGSCYCRRCIVLLVVTLVLGRWPMLCCCMFGGLVCLKMCLLLFGVLLFPSAQSLALKHLQVYCTLLRFPMNILRFGQWISLLTYPRMVDSMGFKLVLISWQSLSSLSLFQLGREPYQLLR